MILIKPMQPQHVDAVHVIECVCFTTPWRKSTFLNEVTSDTDTVYIVALLFEPFCEPQIVGYAGMWQLADEGHITNIAVKDGHRRKGIANRLLDRLDEIATQRELIGITLEVRASNLGAQNLYEQHGFVIEGRRKGYYSDNDEDAYIMWKRPQRCI